MGFLARVSWTIRRELWNWIARTKFKNNEPLAILPIPRSFEPVASVTFSQVFPDVVVPSLQVAADIPKDEKRPWGQYIKKRLMFGAQRWLYRVFPPMQPGVPSIDYDMHAALRAGYTARYDRVARAAAERQQVSPDLVLQRPMLPPELHGGPDFGLLAVRGPYAAYLNRLADDEYEWNLEQLSDRAFTCHAGLYQPWAHVRFRVDHTTRRLRATEIRTGLGTSRPTDANWSIAERIALCALSTHTGLVRHWNWLHLMAGESFAIATRNTFKPDHPLCRLLWPHIYGTQQSNRFGNIAQLVPRGDFEQIYSFTHDGMCALMEASTKEFDMLVVDPMADSARRGLANSGIELPTQLNLEALYRVMHRHARRYVELYYARDAEVQADRAIREWIESLGRLLPHAGIATGAAPTVASLADLVARFIFLVSAYHESVGALLWNYQLWTSVQPIRVYRDGRRDSVDVYQRLVNTNYLLQVIRAPLMGDYSGLALVEPTNAWRTEQAKVTFQTFRAELDSLQHTMDREPRGFWKLYPNMLEVNINA